MRAEILSIGTEILIGSTLDTNSRFLSEKLAENAVDVYHHHTVGDNIQRISQAFRAACESSDLILSTGGLGPTEDDATVRGLRSFSTVRYSRKAATASCIAKGFLWSTSPSLGAHYGVGNMNSTSNAG